MTSYDEPQDDETAPPDPVGMALLLTACVVVVLIRTLMTLRVIG